MRSSEFMRRGEVVALLGIDYGAVDGMRVELRNGGVVPCGKIGAIRGMSRSRGRRGGGYWLYRRRDVMAMLE